MKKNYLVLGVLGLAVMASAVFGTSALAARNGNGNEFGNAKAKIAMHKNLTEADRSAWQAKFDAVTKALEAKDYNAWVIAKKAINPDCPLLTKINASNFAKYVEAYNLRKQAGVIMKDLGLEGQEHGMMMGKGKGMGRGMGMGHMGQF
jgi:hypothetical protein